MADGGDSTPRTLPANAHRELAPGEVYTPVIGAHESVPEVTRRSIGFGLFMSFLFSGAAAYITLKLGQGIETAIPIAILAIGLSAIAKRKSTLLENVNVLAFGATSGIVVGGSVFVMPAIYILHLEGRSSFLQITVVPLLGAILGVLFLIPFRRYFVAEMHGKLPYPEGTASTEVLMTGEAGGSSARTLVTSMGVGAFIDFVGPAMVAWREEFSSALVGGLDKVATTYKAVFSLNTTAAVLGLGYLTGIRYASIIMAGSMLSFFVLVPLIAHFGALVPGATGPDLPALASMDADGIFENYVRYIGIGGIFAAGILSILKMSGVIKTALGTVLGRMFRRGSGGASEGDTPRTERDIPNGLVFGGIAVIAIVLWLYFRFSVLTGYDNATWLATVAVFLALLVSFLFAAVSSWAVAMISITPISGMTLTTLIISAVLLSRFGLEGEPGMIATLLIGGVVCTSLSMAGSLVTQFKIGYWLGSTPKTIEWGNVLGSVLAAVTTTAVMILLGHVYGFRADALHPNALPAPQPNAMADVVQSIMGGKGAPWFLYALGAGIAVLIEMIGVSGLAFALGMYLPMSLNSPLLLGAAVAWLVERSSKNPDVAKARNDRGILIASGLIAGGALIGVFSALLRFFEDSAITAVVDASSGRDVGGFSGAAAWVYSNVGGLIDFGNDGPFGNWLGLGVFATLAAYVYFAARRAKSENPA